MNKIKKHLIGCEILILMVLLTAGLHQRALAQVNPCSKPKVAVMIEIEEANEGEFVKYLNEQYPSQPKGSWLFQIQEKVLEELRMNSPGTQFIPATGGIPSDCDYSFKYGLSIKGGGENIEYAGHLKLSEDTLYQMHSTLRNTPPCGKKNYILSVKRTKNMDIFHTIEQNIAAHGNIGNRIKEHEESHRVPPRGPEIKVSQDRKYVSPLEEERKLKLKIDVMNCKGEPVYDPEHGQEVILPKKTERGELNCPKGFPEGEDCKVSGDQLYLYIRTPKGASATYTLKSGMNAEKDPIKILTCGIDNKATEETKIQIHGLELKVKPEKKEVFPMDEPKITVQLSEVDEKGVKQPVAGKHIQINVEGLVDGDVDPSGDVITDQNGKAILFYDAGEKDKEVIFKAKFQPKDYPESVKDETAITVSHYEGYVIMTYSIDYDHKDGLGHYEGHYHKDATVRYNFGKELQSCPIGENVLGIWYPLELANIIKANAKDVDNQRPPRTRIRTGSNFHVSDVPKWTKNYIIMSVDTKTGKFVNGGPFGLSVDFTWSDGTESCIDGGDEEGMVTGGDGVHVVTGSCSGYPGWVFSWTVHMRKRH